MPDKGILAVGFFNPPVGLGGGGLWPEKDWDSVFYEDLFYTVRFFLLFTEPGLSGEYLAWRGRR